MLCSTAATSYAQASKPDDYKKAIESAVLEFDTGNWAEARVLFEQAHALRPSARTLRGMGKVSFELKEYVRAQKELNASLTELRSPLSEAQRHEVLGLLLRVEKFIGRLNVHVKPAEANASVILDGSRVEGELKLDLGPHDLSVQATGYRPLTRTVSIEGGKNMRLELTLTPVDSGDTGAQPTAASRPELAVDSTSAGVSISAATDPAPLPPAPLPSDSQRSGVFQQWWFWAIVSAVVVGGAVTAIALSVKPTSEPPVPGSTGLSVQVLTWSPSR